jgi:hypothetical protein
MKSTQPRFGLWSLALALTSCTRKTRSTKGRTPHGDLAMELVGQVSNGLTDLKSIWVSLFVDGIDAVFTSPPHNETTARFSFTPA